MIKLWLHPNNHPQTNQTIDKVASCIHFFGFKLIFECFCYWNPFTVTFLSQRDNRSQLMRNSLVVPLYFIELKVFYQPVIDW